MISVCMATYNGEKYVKDQIESILKQIGPYDEIIVSDDGSKDGTKNEINSINDRRIKFVENKGKHGFTHNFENALSMSRGDYIFLSDQDDIWLDGKVDIVMDALKEADFISHDCITVNSNFEVFSKSRLREFNIKPGFWRHLIKSRYLGCCMAFKRNILEASMPFPQNDDLVEHDIWLAAVAFRYFSVQLIDTPLIYYRRHGQNASEGGFTKGYSITNKIYRRIYRCIRLLAIRRKVKEIKKGN